MSIQLTSRAFANGQRIPPQYTQDGWNISPPLNWTNVPDVARELALIVEDPDAPQAEPFVHWVMYKIPAGSAGLPEKIPHETKLKSPPDAIQGKNSFKKIGYGGPAPPIGHGTHHYQFHLYALDTPLQVQGNLDNKALVAAMSGHILDEGQLVGTYERQNL